jgi:DDE superfamily endonuclease
MLILTDDEVLAKGLELVGFDDERQAKSGQEANIELFKEHYGSMPFVCAQLWEDLQVTNIIDARVSNARQKHFDYFMAALHFLKAYPTEGRLAGIFKRCKRNCRDWSWRYVKKISLLKTEKIVWPAEWVLDNPDLPYFHLSVDGTHCAYHEVKHPVLPYDPQMYSHKTNQPSLAYEVAISLYESKVVSVQGPYKASVHDKTMFNSYLRDRIPQGCMGIADRGYIGADKLSTPSAFDDEALRTFKKRARARQESFFHRLKLFNAVRDQVRHKDIDKHQWSFEAVCVILQYQFENGSPLFEL